MEAVLRASARLLVASIAVNTLKWRPMPNTRVASWRLTDTYGVPVSPVFPEGRNWVCPTRKYGLMTNIYSRKTPTAKLCQPKKGPT
jgi:hypothetical protein